MVIYFVWLVVYITLLTSYVTHLSLWHYVPPKRKERINHLYLSVSPMLYDYGAFSNCFDVKRL